MTDTEQLKRVCAEATPGPWATDYRFGEASMVVTDDVGRLPLATTALYPLAQNDTKRVEANAAFIATFDPPTVSELLTRIEVLEGERKAPFMSDELEGLAAKWPRIVHTVHVAEARAEAAEARAMALEGALRPVVDALAEEVASLRDSHTSPDGALDEIARADVERMEAIVSAALALLPQQKEAEA